MKRNDAILKFFLETTLEKNVGYKRMPNARLEVRIKMVPKCIKKYICTKKGLTFIFQNVCKN